MQNCISDKWLKLVVKNNLVYQFKQTWTSMIENSSKGDNYKLLKHDLKFEDYLDVLDDKYKLLLVKFMTSNHRLHISACYKYMTYHNHSKNNEFYLTKHM
jgi:hypothetical protein